MENRRLFLAAFLSLAVVVLWGRFVQPPSVQAPVDRFDAAPTAEGATERLAAPLQPTASAASAGSAPRADDTDMPILSDGASESDAVAMVEVVELEERATVVETPHYKASFSNRGAQLVSLVLTDEFTESGDPIEMVRERGGEDPYPFGLVSPAGSPDALNDALFVLNRSSDAAGATELRYEHRSSLGAVVKTFRIEANGLIEVEAAVEGRRDWAVLIGPGLRNPDEEKLGNRWLQRMVVLVRGKDEEKLLPSKQDVPSLAPAAGLQWATLEDNYFLTAIVPSSLQLVTVAPVGQKAGLDHASRFIYGNTDGASGEELAEEQALLLSNGGEPVRFLSYFGSKRFDQLAALPYGFEKTVRWGFFSFVARPMYYGLRWIHERIPNYGWAIVLMTMVIKLLFFPLTHKSQKSMAKMQEINPQVQALRNKFRPKLKDKQGRPNPEAQRQMNEEMLALYRKSGVNPASGCLPVLIQIPVFFAFFRLLSTSVELRNAAWIGWVKDLSIPDPWYLLPLLMLVTSVLLQRMTPPPPDPMQRRIMQMFPIMFGFFAITFPSGLVLYWLTNNLLSMAQQAYYLKNKNKN